MTSSTKLKLTTLPIFLFVTFSLMIAFNLDYAHYDNTILATLHSKDFLGFMISSYILAVAPLILLFLSRDEEALDDNFIFATYLTTSIPILNIGFLLLALAGLFFIMITSMSKTFAEFRF